MPPLPSPPHRSSREGSQGGPWSGVFLSADPSMVRDLLGTARSPPLLLSDERGVGGGYPTLRQTCSCPRARAQYAFFIVARAKISVVESCLCLVSCRARQAGPAHQLQLVCLVWGWLVKGKGEQGEAKAPHSFPLSTGRVRRGPRLQHKAEGRGGVGVRIDSMILPQVHLRKPCYDFSFL